MQEHDSSPPEGMAGTTLAAVAALLGELGKHLGVHEEPLPVGFGRRRMESAGLMAPAGSAPQC